MQRKSDFYRGIFFISPNRVRCKPVGPRRERGRTPSESLCLPSIGAANPELGPDIERLNSVDWVIGARSWVTCLHQSAESFWPVRSLDFGQRALARARTCWPG